MNYTELIKKYNVAAPRYTSYPTVPYWDAGNWEEELWLNSVRRSFTESSEQGISLYIHLPFCENLCTYCGCTTRITKNHTFEEPYIAAVLEEWKMYVRVLGSKPRVREIHLGGGTPTFFSPANLNKLMLGLKADAEFLPDASMSFEAHPANTTIQHLQVLYDHGFRRLSLGVQDFDPDVQKAINRRQTTDDINRVCMQAREIGYTSINFDLIYGLPLQKLASIQNTMQEVIRLRPDRIAFYSYAHVPWLKPGQRGYSESDLPEDDEKRMLYETGREALLDAGYKDIGMDHFSLVHDNLYSASAEEKLHRNFMGYTEQYTQLSIGLGVSSISDSWYAFAQNEKKVETYIQAINAGSFSFLKGHILTETDLQIRQNILDLMCKGETSINSEHYWAAEATNRLDPLSDDGLVELEYAVTESGTSSICIRATRTGHTFLRNICMALDQRLWEKAPARQIFSSSV